MEDKFTVEEIKKYILSQDSLGDVLYFLKAENIRKANVSQGPVEIVRDVRFPDTEEMYCPGPLCKMPTLHALRELVGAGSESETVKKWTCIDCGHSLD